VAQEESWRTRIEPLFHFPKKFEEQSAIKATAANITGTHIHSLDPKTHDCVIDELRP
jgi:hypothetical protein